MKSMAVDISDWLWHKIPKSIGSKVIEPEVFVRDIILQMLLFIQETMVEFYLPSYKLKSISIKLFELNALIKAVLDPEELFRVWSLLDRSIEYLQKMALEAECYEGLVNLKKLKEII